MSDIFQFWDICAGISLPGDIRYRAMELRERDFRAMIHNDFLKGLSQADLKAGKIAPKKPNCLQVVPKSNKAESHYEMAPIQDDHRVLLIKITLTLSTNC